jgi:epoxyqueuosine reductase
LRDRLETWFEEIGLIFLGVTDLKYKQDFERFLDWRESGLHGGLAFLERHDRLREDPRQLLPGAQSVIVFALNYYLETETHLGIARYARLKDYHKYLRKQGLGILAKLEENFSSQSHPLVGRVLVDTAPVLERALAAKTREGFIGKNTLYIHPRHGSFLLLAEILVNQPLILDDKVAVDKKARTKEGGCGSCRRCQVHCPTGALDMDYRLDAKLCLSYWTIEHRGLVPEKFWPYFKHYFFGCDICQMVCPYNRVAKQDPLTNLLKNAWLEDLNPYQVAMMNQSQYEAWFGGTPLTRAKIEGLRRNALIVLAVTGDRMLDSALAALGEDNMPLVRDTVAQIRSWLECREA